MRDVRQEAQDAKLEQPADVLNGIKTVVFDLDGTLYDKRGLARRMVHRLWWCLPVLTAERLARRHMHQVHFHSEQEFFDHFFAAMSRGHWWSAKAAAKWYHSIYLPTMVKLIAKYQPVRYEVLALMDECKAKGLKMAIYSDYGSVTDKLDVLKIDPLQFDLLVAAPELGSLKPSKACAAKVLEMLHATPETTLFVGDRDEKDGVSARSVGAKFLLVGN